MKFDVSVSTTWNITNKDESDFIKWGLKYDPEKDWDSELGSIEINTLDELLRLRDDFESIIISNDCFTKANSIEIYNGYRE